MAKSAQIQIKDSAGGKYRVKSVGKNGETLQTSEALESVAAVKKHIIAMQNCWHLGESTDVIANGNIRDCTKNQIFFQKKIVHIGTTKIGMKDLLKLAPKSKKATTGKGGKK